MRQPPGQGVVFLAGVVACVGRVLTIEITPKGAASRRHFLCTAVAIFHQTTFCVSYHDETFHVASDQKYLNQIYTVFLLTERTTHYGARYSAAEILVRVENLLRLEKSINFIARSRSSGRMIISTGQYSYHIYSIYSSQGLIQ